MHIVKKFNRFELKYVLPYKTAVQLKNGILKYALPDPYGDGRGKYTITSLYYDSPDHRFFWEKVDGIKYRRKLRIRWYETEERLKEDSIVFLEIKQRVDRVTQKRRIPLKYKDALLFCREGIIPKYEPEDEATVEEMYSLLKLYDLRPTAITTYERQAFVGADYDMGLRITYDSHVAYRLRDLDLNAGTYDGFIVPPNFIIMEIKTNDRVPYWVTELVAENNLQLIRVSKYCQGLERASAMNYH
ncbi:polyphosphate polymerase domain-containing protein [Patescibacteria group bacterium]|nr:polyphosphate polymerase domain-containing protein [Patescibacteria group bacterium]MBU1922568.1 polyphosphate polymerase domain-containing protein [Patescibacteria group bacterium]